MTMKQWSTTPADNATGSTNVNWAEGQLPSTVNDSARQLMADVRAWYETAEWIDFGYSISYVSATVFKFHDANRTALATLNRRVRAGVGAGTIYGSISDVTFSTSDTQVTVTWDSGSLDASLSAVSLGILHSTNKSLPASIPGIAAGANIASAATIDLTAATGNCPRITGTVATSAVTMNTGQWALVVADGAWPLTYHATTNKISGSADYTLAAGDHVLYHKDLSGIVHGLIIKANGTAVAAGKIVQVVEATPYSAWSNTGVAIPADNTIPQNTEGAEWVTVSITPTSATNRLRIEAFIPSVALSTSVIATAAIFQDSTANALAAGQAKPSAADVLFQLKIEHEMAAGTTSSTTFKLRAGPASGTLYVNGISSTALLGGILSIRLSVTEIAA